jgi:hypothetical protein
MHRADPVRSRKPSVEFAVVGLGTAPLAGANTFILHAQALQEGCAPMVGAGTKNVLTISQNVQVRDPTHCTTRGKASESGVDGLSGSPQDH